jgi:hypothetical protein
MVSSISNPVFRALAVAVALLTGRNALAQTRQIPLATSEGLRPHGVILQPLIFAGKTGVRIVEDSSVTRSNPQADLFATIAGVTFSSGTIEAEIAGSPAPGAFDGARGFVGIAFRVQPDARTYDAFYLRPTNGRAEDQERRNHAVQYVSEPLWPWWRLRRESPSKYEAYVDLEPGVWTKVRIEVHGDHARLYVGDRQQPALIVNDVKSGVAGAGEVALWIGPGTVGHFRNVAVTAAGVR